MIISYFGGQFVKIQFGDTIVAFNPISKDSKLKTTKFGADVAILSLKQEDFNGIDQLVFGERKPFVISGPGEYEVKKVFIKGFGIRTDYGQDKDKINTVYSVVLEGMNLMHLGALSDPKKISKEVFESAEDGVDILLTPIGDNGLIDFSEAYKLAVNLESKIIIPLSNDEKLIKGFLKEGGSEGIKAVDKLTIKKKDLANKNGEIVILSSGV